MLLSRQLLDFKRPVVFHLEHLSIVIEDKILLLLSWKFKRSYLLSIRGLKIRCKESESAVILKVPSHIGVISISISSIWRRRKVKVVLKKVKLDKETSLWLINHFKPFKIPYLTLVDVTTKKRPPLIKSQSPILKSKELNLRSIDIRLQNEKLIHPL